VQNDISNLFSSLFMVNMVYILYTLIWFHVFQFSLMRNGLLLHDVIDAPLSFEKYYQ
jgi:hypothetical protein